MKKVAILLIVSLFLGACMSPQAQQSYINKLQTSLAAEHKVAISEVEISFLQNCAFDVDAIESIFYVKIKGSNTIYQYSAEDCDEDLLSDYNKSIYSEDGKLPDSFEK